MPIWAADAEIDEDLNDVDPNLAIGNYGQNMYDGGASYTGDRCWKTFADQRVASQPMIDEATLAAVQQQMARQAQQDAFSQIPDVVKRVRG